MKQTDASFYKDVKQSEKQPANTKNRSYNYYQQFLQLNPDSFSITRAVYLSEAIFYDNPYSFSEFETRLEQWTELVYQILKRENVSYKDNIALNYGIQRLYTTNNLYFNSKTHNSYVIRKLQYDFDDYMGEKNWEKMLVTKMLQTGSGQCHSMPLFYLCVAEQLNAKAYLSMAPGHSFIQFFDHAGRRYNFETTSGHLVSTTWLMQSTYVNSVAIKNRTFLDTLSSRRLYAQCLSDMLTNYLEKSQQYDNLSDSILHKILSIDSTNVTALMLLNNLCRIKVIKMAKKLGNPPLSDFWKYPDLVTVYQLQRKTDNQIQQTGYQDMPKEAYEKWLQSVEQAKLIAQLPDAQLKYEIDKLKQTNTNNRK